MAGTPIADMVEKMLSGGIPPDTIVLAVRTAELAAQGVVDPAAERRRAWDREAKRKKRETLFCPPDIPPDKLPSLSLPTSIDLFQDSRGTVDARARPKKRIDTRLPEDWAPTDDDLEVARSCLPETAVAKELEKFRDHWRAEAGPKAVKRNWSAAWRNWCRRAPNFNSNNRGRQDGRRSGSLLDATDRLIEKFGGMEAANAYVPGSSGPTPLRLDIGNGPKNLRLIPKG